MKVIELVFYIAMVGFLVYLVTSWVPMPEIFKTVIIGVVAFALVFWVLQSFGLLRGFAPLRLR